MERAFVAGIKPPKERSGAAWWWVFRESGLLVHETDTGTTLPHTEEIGALGIDPVRTQYLGTLGAHHCFAAEVAKETEPPPEMRFEGLRALYGRLPDDLFFLAGRAIQIIAWDRTHQYCGQCGTHTIYHKMDRATECPNCGLVNYPRIAPAVIVAVERGDELLLARNANFPAAFFSVLAGFVEAGESLEETVRRELREEVSIEVKDIRYFGSQSWPFPNSLMVGFTAQYASGEICVDTNEVAEAAWFRYDAIPRVPPSQSIARKLIDAFIDKHSGTTGS
jgi:NAD+ diphosphatase